MDPQIKEIQMDMSYEGSGDGASRKRKGRRRTRRGSLTAAVDHTHDHVSTGAIVEKATAAATTAAATAAATATATATAAATATATATAAKHTPTVVIAPPKKKPTRILLVPSKVTPGVVKKVPLVRKTYTAKRVRLIIDNTAKTQKKRRQTMQRIDALTDEQVRRACLDAKLSRKETVAKVPIGLLRQMLKDYQTMRGSLL